MTVTKHVYIVDDDSMVCTSTAYFLTSSGYAAHTWCGGQAFLDDMPGLSPGCVLLDVRMPEIDGLQVIARMHGRLAQLPVIVMTGHGDVDSARQAFRAQAVDFVEKPIDHDRLMRAIEEAFARQRSQRDNRDRNAESAGLLAALTPREAEVMEQVVAGRHNREIARNLDISPRTVEVHKARLLAKLGVGSIADLVRLSIHGRNAGGG